MSDTTYSVICSGEIAPGQDVETVKQRIAIFFKISVNQCNSLFTGGDIIVKQDVDCQTAERYKEIFEQAGAICYIKPKTLKHIIENPQSYQPQSLAHQSITTDDTEFQCFQCHRITERRQNASGRIVWYCPSCNIIFADKTPIVNNQKSSSPISIQNVKKQNDTDIKYILTEEILQKLKELYGMSDLMSIRLRNIINQAFSNEQIFMETITKAVGEYWTTDHIRTFLLAESAIASGETNKEHERSNSQNKNEPKQSSQRVNANTLDKETRTGYFQMLLIMAVLVAVIFGAYKCTGVVYRSVKSSFEQTQETDNYVKGDGWWDKYTAWRTAKRFVEKQLKFPAESSFPFYDSDFIEVIGDYRYQVKSYVDASNALGVKGRQFFVAILSKEENKWVLESLNFVTRE